MKSDRIITVYSVNGSVDEAAAEGRRIALEQTVEVPAHIVPAPIMAAVVGRVESVAPEAGSAHRSHVTISYDASLANQRLPQLLNLVYGNVSMYRDVRLIDMQIPDSVLAAFPGPRYGVEGLRALTGVYGRPLMSTALKPRGSSVAIFADIAYRFAKGGGDILKDDQNLVDADFESFKHRVSTCAAAVDRANDETGRRCLYFPHIAAPFDETERYFEFVRRLNLKGVLLCSMIVGLENARGLADRYGLGVMGHPAMTGAFTNHPLEGIAHGLLFGTLFRLSGADIAVFPNFGGRFAYNKEQCQDIRNRLQQPLGDLKPAWSCPAGGMHLGNFTSMCGDYGEDSIFLVGGGLLGFSDDLTESTRCFVDRIRANFKERLETPQAEFESSCELPGNRAEVRQHLPFNADFQWGHRSSSEYKKEGGSSHSGVRRVELVGKHGEKTAFDLRYFEIAPGGHSSLEKHLHTHVVIGARGTGVLQIGEQRIELKPNDVGYVEPLCAHQLRNEGSEAFGFFCIVDHERDRPMNA